MASKSLGRFLLKILAVLAFCAVCAYALFLAFGYNVDLKEQHIEKTSIIDVSNRYPEVRVYLGDKLVGNSLPVQMKDLLPGFYKLALSKLGYLPWSRKLEVRPDFVTKVDDVLLVPDHTSSLVQQLAHFPEQSKYFLGKDFFIVFTPGRDYLTLVYLLNAGAMKEEELQFSHQDIQNIQDIQVFDSQKFLIAFADGSYEWVEFGGPKFVDFTLPKGATQITFLPARDAAYFLLDGSLYRSQIELLSTITSKNLQNFFLAKAVDQFDVHDDKIVYISRGMAFSADLEGKNVRLIDRSHSLTYARFFPFTQGSGELFVLRTAKNKRLLYAVDERGVSILLTAQLKGEVYQNGSGQTLFTDDTGNIFLYHELLKKKTLVTTLPPDFSLYGFLFDDEHFLLERQNQVFLADSSYTNVYPLFDAQKDANYFLRDGAVFYLGDQKLKSLFFPPQ